MEGLNNGIGIGLAGFKGNLSKEYDAREARCSEEIAYCHSKLAAE